VADLTIALVIAVSRHLVEALRYVDSGRTLGHDNYEGARWFGHDLAGQTLGLVGFGQVGRRVAQRAAGFGVRLLVTDPFVKSEAVEAAGGRQVSLEELLRESDVVSLHARLTGDNHGLIGAEELAQMRSGACLVNTARHELLDEAALIAALTSGRLGGAALDVVTPSPEHGLHPLLACPNALIVPHIGGATEETLEHGAEMVVDEIQRLEDGRPMTNVVNRTALPTLQRAASR